MSLINLFSKKGNSNDPYWEFIPSQHFMPRVSRSEFFKESSFGLGYLIRKELSSMVHPDDNEIENAKSLSYGQKALYYWWYLDGQVSNGGFIQFYYNGYGKYVSAILKGLEYIGDLDMLSILTRADKIYKKNEKAFTKAREVDLFDSGLYDRLGSLSELDSLYFETNKQTMDILEKYIRKHTSEFCVDEEGNELNAEFTGQCETRFEGGAIKEVFNIVDGKIDGEYRSYHENGHVNLILYYHKGQLSEEKSVFNEDGILVEKIVAVGNNVLRKETFYDNGNPQNLEHRLAEDNDLTGDYKEWYENGQLKEYGKYAGQSYQREGMWYEYYSDGKPMSEIEHRDGEFLVHHYWSDKGEHLLKNGTGVYRSEYNSFGDIEVSESQFENYKRSGITKSYENGELRTEQEFKDGKYHGLRKEYYDNGNLKVESEYIEGVLQSEKKFDKFTNPVVAVSIECETMDNWIDHYKLEVPDVYPELKNNEEAVKNMKIATSFFDGYPQDNQLSYSYSVLIDEQGNVIKLEFKIADNARIIEDVERSIQSLKFTPAIKAGVAIPSCSYIKYKFNLADGSEVAQ